MLILVVTSHISKRSLSNEQRQYRDVITTDVWVVKSTITYIRTCTWYSEVYRGCRRPWNSCSYDRISERPYLFDECWLQYCPETPAKHSNTIQQLSMPITVFIGMSVIAIVNLHSLLESNKQYKDSKSYLYNTNSIKQHCEYNIHRSEKNGNWRLSLYSRKTWQRLDAKITMYKHWISRSKFANFPSSLNCINDA